MTMIGYAFSKPAASKQRDGKKESGDHRHNRACQWDKPFSTSSLDLGPANVLTVKEKLLADTTEPKPPK